MSTPWYRRLSEGLSKSREQLAGQLNVILGRGPEVDAVFWEDLEDALLAADVGVTATSEITESLRRDATRLALPDAAAVIDLLVDRVAEEFPSQAEDLFEQVPMTVLLVGVNGTGKTTTVGKLAKQASDSGLSVLLGSADTFRAAASEQLDVWADRAGVPVVRKDRGADPASVVFDTLALARERHSDLVLIDTAGRLHTSADLMRELEKVARVARAQSPYPVKTVLVVDATTGQNGLVQAREFHAALSLDALVLTKLDGTAKGGIAVAIVRELGIPIVRIGVGEGVADLHSFDPTEYARAMVRGV